MAIHKGSLAQFNFSLLQRNTYPGRGIVAGLDETGEHLVQVYWIMGRSENSRNRIFKCDSNIGLLYTEAADATKMKDSSLVIYNAMRESGEKNVLFIVSNGDQTDTVARSLGQLCLNRELAARQYEPDAPNYTQRITAVSILTKEPSHSLQMSILRKSQFGENCDRLLYEYIPHPGFGHCITTYAGDDNPLRPFSGDPLIMPIRGSLKEVAQTYWDALNEENRVSLAVKFIALENGRSTIHIINKYEQRV